MNVSVIIPVYNGGEPLKKCLSDLAHQTLQDIEIICVNDGSTDHSRNIIQSYVAKDPRFYLIDQENAGAAAARNNGLSYATGTYLLFLDADDFFEPEMLERAFLRAKCKDADIVLFKGDRFDHSRQRFFPMTYALRDTMLPKKDVFSYHDIPSCIFNFVVGWAWDKLYRREFVLQEQLLFQQIRTSNDLFFTFSSLVKAKRICVQDSLLIHHRINLSDSLSVTRDRSYRCFFLAGMALYEELHRMQIYEEVEYSFVNWFLHFSFWNLNTIDGPHYQDVFQIVKDQVLPLLRFDSRQADYFSDAKLYEQAQLVAQMEYMDYLYAILSKDRQTISQQTLEIQRLRQRLNHASPWKAKAKRKLKKLLHQK